MLRMKSLASGRLPICEDIAYRELTRLTKVPITMEKWINGLPFFLYDYPPLVSNFKIKNDSPTFSLLHSPIKD